MNAGSAASLAPLWRGRERFVMLATRWDRDGFLALWQAWRTDRRRSGNLHVIVVDAALPARLATPSPQTDAGSAPEELAEALAAAWPPPTPNLHRLGFDAGAVELLLRRGTLAERARDLEAAVDLFDVGDGSGLGAGDVDARTRTIRVLARLAAPGAWWLADRIDPADAAALRSAGFRLDSDAGGIGGRATACYEPRFRPSPVPGRLRVPLGGAGRRVAIVGAGLAGCATAWALAERGWQSTLLERGAAPAGAASGNPAGLFHGTVNRVDACTRASIARRRCRRPQRSRSRSSITTLPAPCRDCCASTRHRVRSSACRRRSTPCAPPPPATCPTTCASSMQARRAGSAASPSRIPPGSTRAAAGSTPARSRRASSRAPVRGRRCAPVVRSTRCAAAAIAGI
ncbi:FAD-dependent oxidoreductase [Schlegelella sp. ID0723]|uniref:FAD-dependent oxidoreductase n=1 Tax=Piscinibacter koreensis TaxID=2742824 RepID=A0A7Y6TWT0_9BURK|nr:FAD-dependent oxidoreductase [Schlegelella koreensis]